MAAQPSDVLAQQDTTAVRDTAVVVIADTILIEQDTSQIQEAHPQDSPEGRGFLIVTAAGSSALRLRGSLRVNSAYDFRGLQSQENFNTFEIPTGARNTADSRFFMGVNQTRLGLEVTQDTRLGDVFVKIESDFLGQGNSLRLRHAYGTLGRFLVGLTWSTFGDVASLPLTVDLDGPNSAVAVRTVQVRYRMELTTGIAMSVAAEAPDPEITSPDSLTVRQTFQATPDIAARLRAFGEWGHLQIAGIFRTLNVGSDNNVQVLPGYGLLFSGDIDIGESSEILFQAVGGAGVSRYITALEGQGLDIVFNPVTGEFETVVSAGGFLSFGHDWRPNVYLYATVGIIGMKDKGFFPGFAFDHSRYASVNLFWDATSGTRLGIEYSFGRREDKDGQAGNASRLSWIFYFGVISVSKTDRSYWSAHRLHRRQSS